MGFQFANGTWIANWIHPVREWARTEQIYCTEPINHDYYMLHFGARRACENRASLELAFCPYRLWSALLCLWFAVAVMRMCVVRRSSHENSEGSRSLVVIDGGYLRRRG